MLAALSAVHRANVIHRDIKPDNVVLTTMSGLGDIMYEALTGRPPYSGDNYNALLFAIQQGTPTPLDEQRPDLDSSLIEVLSRAMAIEPDARFQTAEEMSQALRPWLNLDAASTPPESSAVAFAPTVVPSSRSPRRH